MIKITTPHARVHNQNHQQKQSALSCLLYIFYMVQYMYTAQVFKEALKSIPAMLTIPLLLRKRCDG